MEIDEFATLPRDQQLAYELGYALALVQAFTRTLSYLVDDSVDRHYLLDAVAHLDTLSSIRRAPR